MKVIAMMTPKGGGRQNDNGNNDCICFRKRNGCQSTFS